ncbi:carbohydrate kinase family protein [Actinoallomurus sp. NPDC052274]|uniref:carbohydrate kinase family protein n=1 Tax=Actinoallomurus sp. NPDC052274 TaxID=3155420 RepID=UPI003441CFEB
MIVFCGYANTDLTVRVPVLPGPGDRVQATGVQYGEGGMAANASVAAARVGADARFAGVVGTDRLSTAFLKALEAEGIGTAWTSRTAALTTAVILLTPDGERSVISQDDAVDTDHIAEVVRVAREAGASWLYLDGYRFPEAATVLAGPPGPHVVVDLDGCDGPEAMRAALSAADHAIGGRAQVTEFLGDDDALVRAAVEHRVYLVVTDGSRGWTLLTPEGERHDGEAIKVTTVDATGAGDCFAGTYCAELDRGTSPLQAALFAAVAAGLSCTRPGARDGLPRRETVSAYLNTHPESRSGTKSGPISAHTPGPAPSQGEET